jgi:hypothetical protein
VSLWTSLEPASATVEPGDTTTVRLRLRNTGDVVDEYRFEAVGTLAPWTAVEPPSLRLYPGTTGTVQLVISPPRTPDAAAGPHPYAVRITPTEHPEAATVPEGNVTVTPFSEVRAELVPPTVKGRFRGRPRLAVDNLGNVPLTASVQGSDNGEQLSYDVSPANVRIEPGRAAFVDTTLRPRRVTWFGSSERRPFVLSVRRSGVAPLDVDGTYIQHAVAPRWLAACVGVLAALAITFTMLWIANKPRVVTSATEDMQPASVSTLPPLPAPASQTPELPAAGASAPPAAAETPAGQDDGAGSGGGGEAEKKEPEAPKKKAAPRTAATVVRERAADDPGGRHICYRLYVEDTGWTDVACDDEVAGTPGSGKRLLAVNIATAGTNGNWGGANVHNPNPSADDPDQNNFPDGNAGVVDGIDHYIGSTKPDAPTMRGFTLNVDNGKGNVCQTSYVHNATWLGLACDKPGEGLDLTYVGTHDNDGWIEAVRLRV